MKRTSAVLALGLFLAVGHVRAEEPKTFRYEGWVDADRWGDLWLSNGVHSVRFAKDALASVRPFAGAPVEIQSHALLPGSPVAPVFGSVASIRAATPRLAGMAKLDLFLGEEKVRRGGVQVLQLRLAYDGSEQLEFRLRDFRVLVRRLGPPIPDTTLDLRDRDGLAWRSDGISTDVMDDGKGKHDTTWVLRSPGEALCTAKGAYGYSTELLLSGLPDGAYEIWATFEDMNLSRPPGVRHKRVAFDVGP